MEHRKAVFSGAYGLSGTLLNATGREFGAGERIRTSDLLITNQCIISCTLLLHLVGIYITDCIKSDKLTRLFALACCTLRLYSVDVPT